MAGIFGEFFLVSVSHETKHEKSSKNSVKIRSKIRGKIRAENSKKFGKLSTQTKTQTTENLNRQNSKVSVEKKKLRPWSEFPPQQLTQTMVRGNCQNGDGGGPWIGEDFLSLEIRKRERKKISGIFLLFVSVPAVVACACLT